MAMLVTGIDNTAWVDVYNLISQPVGTALEIGIESNTSAYLFEGPAAPASLTGGISATNKRYGYSTWSVEGGSDTVWIVSSSSSGTKISIQW